MDQQTALSKMVSPGMRRPGAYRGGIIQIHITRACDMSCYNCTQGSNLAGKVPMIPLELFSKAVDTLKDYFGVVGIFGGNPALHPQFGELCRILSEKIPYERRGLWCNHPKGNGKIMRETFNPSVSNLNVHLSQEAYDEFKRDWPESMPFGLHKDSHHSPVFTALKDLVSSEEERWELISNCDINKNWSSMIGVFRGELRAWFCEIAGAQSMLHQYEADYPDTGVPVENGWWREPMSRFTEQVQVHCHACGIPLRARGYLAARAGGKSQVSAVHLGIFKPKRIDHEMQFVELRSELEEQSLGEVTKYIQNSKN